MATYELQGTWGKVRQELERLPFDKTERVRVVNNHLRETRRAEQAIQADYVWNVFRTESI